jgi:large conductance mechanosensitive channel
MDKKMLDELKKIRELLEPKPAPPAPEPPKGLWAEFKDFMSKYKVMGLAVAFIMGVYLGGLVQSLVKDLLMPLIGLSIPGLADLATYTYTVESQAFGIGNFLVAMITFIIVALVIFILVKMTKKWGVE